MCEMSNLGNKKTMAENIRYYLEKTGKDRRQLADDLGFPYSTVANWMQGVAYPRIDRIEKMANYFNVTKADLVEERTGGKSLYEKIMSLSEQKRAAIENLIDQLSD
jgi:transcriptional regulator with XRE-family HTH domain